MKVSPLLSIAACALLLTVATHAGINTWTLQGPAGGGGSATAVAVHPIDGNLVLLATLRGIHRSIDAGHTFALVKDDTLNEVNTIVFDPSNPNRVIANDGQLYLSVDAGQTFALMQGPTAQNIVRTVAFAKDGTLYATTHTGRAFKTTSPFQAWTELTVPWAANSRADALVTDPNDAQVLYAGLSLLGVYRSGDGGATWTGPLTTGMTLPASEYFTHIAVDPQDSRVLLGATTLRIYRSTDSGSSWVATHVGMGMWVGFSTDPQHRVAAVIPGSQVLMSADGGVTYTNGADLGTSYANGAAFRPGHPDDLFVASPFGLGYSSDAGLTFQTFVAGLTGLPSADIVANDQGAVYVSMASGNDDLFKRVGTTWQPFDAAPLHAAMSGPRAIGRLAVAAGDQREIFAVNGAHELIRTFDGGASWSTPSPVFLGSSNSIMDVQIDPGNAQVAYVSRTDGIWKTTNAGTTFTQLTNAPANAWGVGVSPLNSQVVFASGGTNTPSGIYQSVDGGAHWSERMAPNPTGGPFIESFTFHPTDPKIIYAAGLDLVYQSSDGGDSWSAICGSSVCVTNATALLIDPLVPTTLTLVEFTRDNVPGLERSVDGGITWERTLFTIPGPVTFLEGAVLDPLDSSHVIAITTGAGVAEYTFAPDLSVTMSAFPSLLPSSSSTSAGFTVTNHGPHASSASELVIDVPAWITPSVPSGCTLNSHTLRCQLGSIAVNAARSVTVDLGVGAAGSTGQVSATVTGNEDDPNTSDNQVATPVMSEEFADLEVAFNGTTTTVNHGASLRVTATVSNDGPSPSTQTVLTLQLPANLSAQNVSPSSGTCTPGAGTLVCNLGTVANKAMATVSFDLRGDAVGISSVMASVQGAGQDTDNSSSASRQYTVLAVADMGVTLTESADPVDVGAGLRYVATISNAGPDAPAFVIDIPVVGAAVSNVTTTAENCAMALTGVRCASTGLATGSTATITLDLTDDVPGIISATATVSADGSDGNAANNSATVGTTVRILGDISVDITDSADPVNVNVAYSYTVTVRNAGPNAGGVHVGVPVTGATVTSASMPGATCTATSDTVACDIASLAKDGSATLTIGVSSASAGTASATATVTFSGTDSDSKNDTATANTTVVTPPSPPGTGGSKSGGGGGGGGSFDWLLLALLGALGAWRIGRGRMAVARGLRDSPM